MSEYQYYEFQAVDRPLSDDEMRALRQLSSRARITATSFVNVYNYGDFKGEPSELMDRFFDLHVYVANWGTRQLMIRVPASLLDGRVARQYAPDTPVLARSHGGHTILEFQSNNDDYAGDWEEGEGWIDRLRPGRDGLMNGDLRALYLGWLLLTMYDEDDSEEIEPPVPDGLARLDPALDAFVDFLRIDRDLIAVAAERSGPLRDDAPHEDDLRAWIERLPVSEKDDLLMRAIAGDDIHLGATLLRKFRESASPGQPAGEPVSGRRRTAGELIALWRDATAARERAEAEQAAREHAARMDDIAARSGDLWRAADLLAEEKNAKSYEQAIERVSELHAAATHFGTLEEFERRRAGLRAKHARRTSFTRMLDEVGKPRSSSSILGVWKPDVS